MGGTKYLLSEQEIAERLGIARRTLQRWRQQGGGPPFTRLSERRIAYPVAEADRWAAERTFSSRAAEMASAAKAANSAA